MKKLLMFAGLILFLSGTGIAGQADLFSYDQETVKNEMASLTSLEDYVLAHPGVNLSDLLISENALVADLSRSTSFYGIESMNEKVLGIGGFLWGCCLGPIGVLVVWLGADDSAETRKAIIGCIVNALLSGGSSIFYYSSY